MASEDIAFIIKPCIIWPYMVNHMRHTRGHTRNRRSHHALTSVGYILCEACGQPRRKHVACSSCGVYKKSNVLNVKAKEAKEEKKAEKKKVNKSKAQ